MKKIFLVILMLILLQSYSIAAGNPNCGRPCDKKYKPYTYPWKVCKVQLCAGVIADAIKHENSKTQEQIKEKTNALLAMEKQKLEVMTNIKFTQLQQETLLSKINIAKNMATYAILANEEKKIGESFQKQEFKERYHAAREMTQKGKYVFINGRLLQLKKELKSGRDVKDEVIREVSNTVEIATELEKKESVLSTMSNVDARQTIENYKVVSGSTHTARYNSFKKNNPSGFNCLQQADIEYQRLFNSPQGYLFGTAGKESGFNQFCININRSSDVAKISEKYPGLLKEARSSPNSAVKLSKIIELSRVVEQERINADLGILQANTTAFLFPAGLTNLDRLLTDTCYAVDITKRINWRRVVGAYLYYQKGIRGISLQGKDLFKTDDLIKANQKYRESGGVLDWELASRYFVGDINRPEVKTSVRRLIEVMTTLGYKWEQYR